MADGNIKMLITADSSALQKELQKLADKIKAKAEKDGLSPTLPGGKSLKHPVNETVNVPAIDKATGKPVTLNLPKKEWDEATKDVVSDLMEQEDEAFTKLVNDSLDGKGMKTVGYGTAATSTLAPELYGESALATAYKQIKEFVEKHPAPKLVKPKAPKPWISMDFSPEDFGYSDSIKQHSDILLGIDPGTNEQSAMSVKMLKSKNVPADMAFAFGADGKSAMVTGIGKPETPATMEPSPKKGINVKDLLIYRFGPTNEGNASMKHVLGGKGANLAEMATMGFPVPAGFTIPCVASVDFIGGSSAFQAGYLEGLTAHVMQGDHYLFECFGYHPLVSVRSGAPVSMPGMMDTILNVGINDENLEEWKQRLGERAALDSYRRFLQMYGATALDIEAKCFEDALQDIKAAAKVIADSELEPNYLLRLIKRYKDIYTSFNKAVPKTRQDAIMGAVEAVFRSWNSPRAQAYRADNNIPFEMGTAVNVQAMVFGNMNDQSCSGVAFTRDKATGTNAPTGDFLVNAQGEEVVSGTRTPDRLSKMKAWNSKLFYELLGLMKKLEDHYKDMQDVEFTVQDGKLYMLQTRTAKRSALAEFKVAHDMVVEGLITIEEALQRVTRQRLLEVMKPSIDPKFKGKPVATGVPVGGSVVTGMACFDSHSATACKAKGKPALLIRKETDPDDYDGIRDSVGVLTATGGATAHAALVCNGMDKPCVVGCSALKVEGVTAQIGNHILHAGEWVSIDGSTGNVWLGEVPVTPPKITKEVQQVAAWFAKEERAHRVTADTTAGLIAGIKQAPEWVKTLYVDTCILNDAGASLSILGDFVEELGDVTLIIDLSGPDGSYGKCDKAVDKLFGLASGSQDNADLKATELLCWEMKAIKKTLVKIPKSCTIADQLRWKGFKVLGPVKTVADLLGSATEVTIDDETIKQVFGSKEALLFVQDAMAKAGKLPGKPVPTPQYWWEPLMRKGA